MHGPKQWIVIFFRSFVESDPFPQADRICLLAEEVPRRSCANYALRLAVRAFVQSSTVEVS